VERKATEITQRYPHVIIAEQVIEPTC